MSGGKKGKGPNDSLSIIASLILVIIAASLFTTTLTAISPRVTYSRLKAAAGSTPSPPPLPTARVEKSFALKLISEIKKLLNSQAMNESIKDEASALISVAEERLRAGDTGGAMSNSLKALADVAAGIAAREYSRSGVNSILRKYEPKYASLTKELQSLNASVFAEISEPHSIGYIANSLAYAQYFVDYAWRILSAGNESLNTLSAGNGTVTDAMIVARAYALASNLCDLAKEYMASKDVDSHKVIARDAARILLGKAEDAIRNVRDEVQPYTIGARLLDYASSLVMSASNAIARGRYAVACYYAIMAEAYAAATEELSSSLYVSNYFNITISADAVLMKRAEAVHAYVTALASNSTVVNIVLASVWSDIASGDRDLMNCVNAFCLHKKETPLSSYDLVPSYIYYARGAALAEAAFTLLKRNE